MKTCYFICPDQRHGLSELDDGNPLILSHFLGKAYIDHVIHALAADGYRRVILMVAAAPNKIREFVGDGFTWGVDIEVQSVASEPSVAEVRTLEFVAKEDQVLSPQSFPLASGIPVFLSSAAWFQAHVSLYSHLLKNQLNVREIQPGVWAGIHTRIAPTAVLEPPCWIGHHSLVGAHAKVLANSFIENNVIIDDYASIRNSVVCSDTYLGKMTNLENSIASGVGILNHQRNSFVKVVDDFLLSNLKNEYAYQISFSDRLVAVIAIALTFPVVAIAYLFSFLRGQPFYEVHRAVLNSNEASQASCVHYIEFSAFRSIWKYWPRMLRIVTGHFAWVGNPPLSPDEAATFTSEFEKLWFKVPPALFTSPEAEGCRSPWGDQARAHAALFAVKPTLLWKRNIILSGLKRMLK